MKQKKLYFKFETDLIWAAYKVPGKPKILLLLSEKTIYTLETNS